MTLIIFTMLCNLYHYLIPKLFPHPKQKLCSYSVVTPILLSLQALLSSNLLSIFYDFAYCKYIV